MKIKSFAIFTFFLLYAAQTKAQQNEFSDKVYLNNGTVIIGKILYYQPDDTLQIQIKSGQIVRFLPTQMKKIVMQDVAENKPTKTVKPYNFKERGLYDALSVGLNTGKSSRYNQILRGIDLQNVVGFQHNRLVGGGIGLGYSSYYLSNGEANVLSIFVEV